MRIVLLLAASAVALLASSARAEQYTSRFDNVDIDAILKNERLLKSYFRCIMDEGRCSPDAAELKKNIPDALENDCSKCSEKQRGAVEKVMKHIYNKKPELFKKLEAKYDSKGVYRSKYRELAEEQGVKL